MMISKAETVRDWILASDVVVSSYSTSLIEASIAGKPAYIVEPVAWPESLRQDWHQLAPRLTSIDEFVSAATSAAKASDAADLNRWARDSQMSRGDAILSIADEIARIRRREVQVPTPAPWQSVTVPSRRRLPPRIVYEWRRHVRPFLPQGPVEVVANAVPGLAAMKEVPERIAHWREILDPYLDSIGRPR
jgi:hypothetical protein